MQTIDFQRSFLTFRVDLQAQPAITLSHKPPTTENNARIQLECVCSLRHQQSGEKKTYVLGASCKTERVGGLGDLWLLPNADFCPIVSDDEFLIIKSWEKCEMRIPRVPASLGFQSERQSGDVNEAWTRLTISIQETEGRRLENIDEIIAATFDNAPLISCTGYSDGGYDICIEHPIKTFNVSEREGVFQTDTGPIILPSFSRQTERLIEHFDLAYSAFNSADWAEFVVNVPTVLNDEISVNHYSQTRRIENVTNSIISL
ncbi:MAG: hypothetical protein ABI210_03445 [Abditibacteriaceae bacterium]